MTFLQGLSHDLLLELWDDQNKGSQPYVLTIITHNPKYLDHSVWFYMKLSQQGLFLEDDQNKGSQPYVLTIITHNPKYLDQFCMVLHETFTTGSFFGMIETRGHNPMFRL